MHSTVSFGAVDIGTSVLIDNGNMAKQIAAGSVVWIPANFRHACNPLPSTAWSFQMLYLDPHWITEACQLEEPSAFTTDTAREILISNDAGLYSRFCGLTDLLFSQAPMQRKHDALTGLIESCQAASWEKMPNAASVQYVSPELQAVLQKIQRAPSAEIDWDEEARLAGLSRTQLIRAFKRLTGMTPHSWQQNARVNAAREQLRCGQALADVAYAQGFSDQAHFQRVFKSLAGSTPGNYRA